MPDFWLPYPRRELIAMRRCPDCGCHSATQGHKDGCPRDETCESRVTGQPTCSKHA